MKEALPSFEFWHDVQHNATVKTLRRGEYPVALSPTFRYTPCEFAINLSTQSILDQLFN